MFGVPHGMLDVFAERLARHVDAGEQLETRRCPGGDAAVEDARHRVAVAGQDRGGAFGEAVVVVAQHDARRAARHQLRELQLEAAQRHRARQQQMALRKDQLLAHIDQRELAAVADHAAQRGADRDSDLRLPRHVACCGVI